MVPNDTTSARIVKSWAGSGTAETIYQDQYGRTWKHDPSILSPRRGTGTAPDMIGTIVGDLIVTGTR
jgi:hypothetical protein